MSKLFKINDKDNVAVALEELKKGEIIDNIKLFRRYSLWAQNTFKRFEKRREYYQIRQSYRSFDN